MGIGGKDLRLALDEWDLGTTQIIFNEKRSHRVIIIDGLPQSHNEGGPIFNVHVNDTLENNLITSKSRCHDKNISGFYHADDGLKMTKEQR